MSSENGGLVQLVHATARGRVRLAVSGLYRSQRLKQVLEDALAGVGSIRAVQANPLTGRLLVIYAPQTPLTDIVSLVESQLGEKETENREADQARCVRVSVCRGCWTDLVHC